MATKTWGINDLGQTLVEGDKILCGIGEDTWYTHVQFDTENNSWHRESDYSTSKKVGNYTPVVEDWDLSPEEWQEYNQAVSWLVNSKYR